MEQRHGLKNIINSRNGCPSDIWERSRNLWRYRKDTDIWFPYEDCSQCIRIERFSYTPSSILPKSRRLQVEQRWLILCCLYLVWLYHSLWIWCHIFLSIMSILTVLLKWFSSISEWSIFKTNSNRGKSSNYSFQYWYESSLKRISQKHKKINILKFSQSKLWKILEKSHSPQCPKPKRS